MVPREGALGSREGALGSPAGRIMPIAEAELQDALVPRISLSCLSPFIPGCPPSHLVSGLYGCRLITPEPSLHPLDSSFLPFTSWLKPSIPTVFPCLLSLPDGHHSISQANLRDLSTLLFPYWPHSDILTAAGAMVCLHWVASFLGVKAAPPFWSQPGGYPTTPSP